MKWLKTLFLMFAFLAAILFSMQNKEMVTLRFGLSPLVQHVQWVELANIPLFLAIFCALFLGALLGGLSDFFRFLHLKKALLQHQKTIERLEREVHSLRGTHWDQPSLLRKEA